MRIVQGIHDLIEEIAIVVARIVILEGSLMPEGVSEEI
jgi:hypothetical protein